MFEKLDLRDMPSKNIIRIIQGFKEEIKKNNIFIKDDNRVYSKQYSELLKEFLVIF